eukprot:6559378-Pyramimonas_sp.AAC.1
MCQEQERFFRGVEIAVRDCKFENMVENAATRKSGELLCAILLPLTSILHLSTPLVSTGPGRYTGVEDCPRVALAPQSHCGIGYSQFLPQ